MARILIIDNVRDTRRSLASALQAKGHETHEAADGKDAIENLRTHNYDLLITEVLLTEIDAPKVLDYLEAQPHRPPVIALSGGNSQIPAEMALLMVKPQVAATFARPVADAEVVAQAEKLLAA